MRAPTWLAGALIALAALLAPAAAHGHAEPVAAEPPADSTVARAPDRLRLVLGVPVEDQFLELRATTPGGAVVSQEARRDPLDPRAVVAPLGVPPTATGLVVAWRALSVDGHVTGGRYAIGIGGPPPTVDVASPVREEPGPLVVAARLLMLAGPLGLLGMVVLAAGVVGPAVLRGGLGPPGESPGVREALAARAAEAVGGAARGWWMAWTALLGAWVLGLALQPVALLSGLREGPAAAGELLGDTDAGMSWRLQAAAIAVTVVATIVSRRAVAGGLPDAPLTAVGLGFGPAAALLAVSASGHASTGGDQALNVGIDYLHNLATAAWLGGLLGLAVLALPAMAALGESDRTRLGAAVVVRFSALALTAVGALVVTGVYRALAEVPIEDLLDTGYGRALLVKLAVFAVLLVGGAYNRLVVHPRLERAALGLDPGDRGAAAALRVSVRAELVVAALLLVCVAVLVSLAPPV